MKIKLLKDWQQLKAGHVFEPQPNVAGELIRRGAAEEVVDITVAEEIPDPVVTEVDGFETASATPPENAMKRGRGRPRKHPLPVK